MAIPANRPQNRILLVGGIVFALLAGVVVFLAVSKAPGSSSGPTVNVFVAAQDIPAGTSLTPDMLTQVSLPQNTAPIGYITDKSLVTGKTAPIEISPNTPITQALLNTAVGAGGTALSTAHLNISKGYVALAIPAKGQTPDTTVDQVTVGYYIQAEDHIDILVDMGGPNAWDHSVRYAFQDVRVLRVGTTAVPTAANAGASSVVALSPPAFFIIELPRAQAEMMVALISGKFAGSATANAPTIMKYVLRTPAEAGAKDANGNYITPKYLPSTGAVPSVSDSPVTAASLAASFPR